MILHNLKFHFLLAVVFAHLSSSFAQIIPAPDAQPNYTNLVFDFPPVDNAAYYEVSFFEKGNTKPFHIIKDSTSVSFCGLFEFNTYYRWNYKAYNAANELLFSSEKFGFHPVSKYKNDSLATDFLIRSQYSNSGYIINDYAMNVVDFKGKLIWYLPKLKGLENENIINFRDLRMTPSGSFTGIIDPGIALEFDRDGHVLWLAPSSQVNGIKTKEKYHHEFRKLSTGNYMIMSEEEQSIKLNPRKEIIDSLKKNKNVIFENGSFYAKGIYGTIVEYDKNGKEIWKWNSAPFFAELTETGWTNEDTHANAFYIDEANNILYVGFRHISLIVKVNKLNGKVIECYGKNLSPNYKFSLGGEFALQHSIEITADKGLLLFNNSDCETNGKALSDIMIIRESDGKTSASVEARISCLIDQMDDGRAGKFGSADQLPDGNYLLGIGALGRIVVADRTNNNTIIHDMILRKYQNDFWDVDKFYRTHYTPSFYPTYYSVKKVAQGVQITNEGTTTDSYTLKTTSKNGSGNTSKPVRLEPGQHVVIESNGTSYEVSSSNDPLLTKKLN